MSSTCTASALLHTLPLRRVHKATCSSCAATPRSPVLTLGRRPCLFVLTAATLLRARESPVKAEDIPLFGLRKKLKKVEQEAEEILKEGFDTAEKGIETAERGIETAERGIETAERGIETVEREVETAISFGGLAQAGAVAGTEAVGILAATSLVNEILGPEGQKS
ncbi:uncharacterized protein LOC131164633 [Malania oleifera]|uniref:uncharacterized protein LOC131164633 n=1 Tax=Malania oleifera TaxID=397392 RepID=UPI0025AEB839|nr:uncharacterized protein LOC131164633 [Malania oleifera]